ncbi:MAG: hypothetical protein GF417_07205 [Candidatus Latescibacteria bacterium]|nr:hypothetical protein [bacterium]MBD3424207.1 hypothetical protein [Candidatus Latescibacterota bacterium]
MNKILLIIVGAAALFFLACTGQSLAGEGRIYGRVIMRDGNRYQGMIRWDRNEGSWIDMLHGNMELIHDGGDNCRGEEDRETISIFGFIKIETDSDDLDITRSAVSFGHIRSIEVLDDESARITLKSGHQMEFEGGSSDIGDSNREILVEDRREGKFEVQWNDIDRIEFTETAPGLKSTFGERLYGTLKTGSGDTYTGWICWDEDELFGKDLLDGDQGTLTREIGFSLISSIRRQNSESAVVTLESGKEMVLDNSNDVDDSNRGIVVYVDRFGLVTVYWDEFHSLDFEDQPYILRYEDFDGGRQLYGTVFAGDGSSYTGRIRWDNDEEWSWDFLDGEFRDVEYEVEFGNIRSIERRSRDSAVVVLNDGSTFIMSGSNDVNYKNKGIYIMQETGEQKRICWDEFSRVLFE